MKKKIVEVSTSRDVSEKSSETGTAQRSDLVVWSGGCDSTLIVCQLASKMEKGKILETITVKHHQVSTEKLRMEAISRERMAIFIKAKYGVTIRQTIVCIHSNGNMSPSIGENPQATIWLAAVIPYLTSHLNIHFGYIKDDYGRKGKADFIKTFGHMAEYRDLKDVKIVFDLERMDKKTVLKELSDLEVPDNCMWWCEYPKADPEGYVSTDLFTSCGKCEPCVTHNGGGEVASMLR
ncbi:MAG: 7-cyano-7-deazaguanine synthase [Lentisphaerota bacterium]